MQTRIREYRKRNGLTLQELANKVGTTPQTVQRLETANMTVSTDWLEKFANVFGVHPSDLLENHKKRHIALLGTIGADASIREQLADQKAIQDLDIPADDPVAARLNARIGTYPAQALLIANRLKGPDMINAHGRDCLVSISNGDILLRRVIRGRDDTFTLVPHETGLDTRYDQKVDWIARIVMSVLYL